MNVSDKSQVTEVNRSFEERAVAERAAELGMEYVNIGEYPLNPDILKFLPAAEAAESGVMPFDHLGKSIKVAVQNPDTPEAKKALEKLSAKHEIKTYLCSESGFHAAYKFYGSDFFTKKQIHVRTEFIEDADQALAQAQKDFGELEKKIPTLPAAQALSEIEILAIRIRATDIHLQPLEQHVVVRFRIDGVLHDGFHIPLDSAEQIITRVKYEAGMRSNIRDLPQDGHLSFTANNRHVELRVSTLPTGTSIESVVLRVLDSERGIKSFSDLGFSAQSETKILESLQRKNGMVLVTGPTGSGKTTTLYSMLKQLNSSEKKLVTLEDPIEYRLEGVTQSQVDENREYNFDNGLRAMLRHDPDVILVGEIRSIKTAKLAAEAALTGHVVLSSLHSNTAVGAISRLRNLGLEDYNIAPSINAIFAQRLVRKVCPHCAKRESLPKDVRIRKALDRIRQVHPDTDVLKKVPKAVGCEKCGGIGYLGQTAICEAFTVSDAVRKMILDRKSEVDVLSYLREHTDFLTLFEDGLIKALNEETTLEELYRVAL